MWFRIIKTQLVAVDDQEMWFRDSRVYELHIQSVHMETAKERKGRNLNNSQITVAISPDNLQKDVSFDLLPF